MTRLYGRPVRILMVEDDPEDALLTRESLRASKVRNEVTVVQDGQQALQRLKGGDGEPAEPPPDLVLLDIDLPGMSGLQLLETIKNDPDLKATPVVMLTTSAEDADILKSYENHAAAFIQKPLGIGGFAEVVTAIEQFYFEVVLLPNRE